MKRAIVLMGALTLLALLTVPTVGGPPDAANDPVAPEHGAQVFLPAILRRYPKPPDLRIRLRSRTFTPAPGMEQGLLAQMRSRAAERTHVLIQFERVPTAAERDALAEQGVTLLAYIPNLAWFASLPTDVGLARRTLENRPARWMGSILPEDKIDPFLLANGAGPWAQNPDGSVRIKVTFFEDVAREAARSLIARLGGAVESEFTASPSFWISIDPAQIRALIQKDAVQFVGFYPPPSETINDGSTTWTGADDVQALGITGAGVTVSLWDGDEADDAHGDLAGRVIFGELPRTNTTREHSTHVACTMAGNGSINANLAGYAPGAPTIVSYDYNDNVTNEYVQALADHGVQVANNSWGAVLGWRWDAGAGAWVFGGFQSFFGAYTLDAPEYDGFVRDDRLTIVWAVGNDRNDPRPCCTPPQPGDPDFGTDPADWDQGVGNNGYDTLGPRATAKNVIAVGAIADGSDGMSGFSNWGPTDDGRIKPDVVAPGVDIRSCDDDANDGGAGDVNNGYVTMSGTSMAAPAVSGSAALIIEQFNATFGRAPLPSTIKALLVNEAVDLVDNPHTAGNDNLRGPDFIYGWGRIDVQAAIDRVRDEQVTEGRLDDGDPADTYVLQVAPGTPQLRVTIAWDDAPAAENADPTLVNDLDLVLIDPDGATHLPWTLDPGNPNTPATTGMDRLNNVEQVQVDAPMEGTWEVRISPHAVPEGPQAYSLVPFQTGADLAITKGDDPDPAIAGGQLTYQFSVTNNGSAEAPDVTVTDYLPPQVSYQSDTASGICSLTAGGVLTCDLGDLPAGTVATFEVAVAVDADAVYNAGGPFNVTNTAEVSSSTLDPNPADNSVSQDTLLVAAADLEIASFVAVDPPEQVLVGQPAQVLLRKVVTNNGPSAPMDATLDMTAAAPGDSSVTPATAGIDVLALAQDEPRTVEERFTLTCGTAGDNTFTFSNAIQPRNAADSDPDPSNNLATLELEVECVVPVAVNIKPGSYPNSIHPLNRGMVPLAVLTTSAGEYDTPLDFDATTVDPLSVRFGPRDVVWSESGGAFEAHHRGHIEDARELNERTRDGDDDMVLHFETAETGIQAGDTEACVKGEWTDAGGQTHRFFGCDSVRTVPPKVR
jgi:uncharacterized repeat protein (TIGR01451 family)